jgi:hypothetical protein
VPDEVAGTQRIDSQHTGEPIGDGESGMKHEMASPRDSGLATTTPTPSESSFDARESGLPGRGRAERLAVCRTAP